MTEELTQFSDDELTEELMWRGWTVNKAQQSLAPSSNVLSRMEPVQFISRIEVEYGIAIPRGIVTRNLLGKLLSSHPNIVTYDALIDSCYGGYSAGGPDGAMETLKVLVCTLRKRLAPTPYRIVTSHGIGWQLKIDPPAEQRIAS